MAEQLIGSAIKSFFPGLFPKIEKLSKKIEESPYATLMEAVYAEGGVVLYDECNAADYASTLNEIKPLEDLIVRYQPDVEAADKLFLKEFVLWALAEYQKLGKERLTNGFQFRDLF